MNGHHTVRDNHFALTKLLCNHNTLNADFRTLIYAVTSYIIILIKLFPLHNKYSLLMVKRYNGGWLMHIMAIVLHYIWLFTYNIIVP